MARKKRHEEHENLERWLVSYADFITLLFAFFVVMYSISAINEGKFRVLSESLVSAFRADTRSMEPVQFGDPLRSVNPQLLALRQMPTRAGDANPAPAVTLPNPTAAAARAAEALKEMSAEIEKALAPLIEQDVVKVRRSRLWMEVEINTSILFASGSARLSPGAVTTLGELAGILARHPNTIHVEGFTDNRPINTAVYPSNWELSAARAAAVVQLFAQNGVDPQRLAAVGYGEFHPVGDNDTPEGRNANRRVVLVIMAGSGARRPFQPAAEAGAESAAGADAAAAPALAPIPQPIGPVIQPIVPAAAAEVRP
jgi:chemotaxis protein MotB